MSGIVGYIGSEDATKILIEALKKLEYRGYDSCGIAVMTGKKVDIRKEVGGLKKLEELLQKRPLTGNIGIGHTRWASHGKVSLDNAHPQVAGDITLVHNGIINNYISLREQLTLDRSGRKFISDTDTEVLAHLIDSQFKDSLEETICSALKDVEGTYALAALSPRDPEKIVVATKEFSIVIGLCAGMFIFASDVTAILPHTRDVIFLGEQEIAVLTKEGVSILDKDGNRISKEIKRVSWNPVMVEKGGYKNFFLKEVSEQPRTVSDTFQGRISPANEISFSDFKLSKEEFKSIKKVIITGCGTSFYAGLIGKNLIEGIAGIPTEVEISSELRDSDLNKFENVLLIGLSQSGATIDTLACIRKGNKEGAFTLGIVNMYASILERIAKGTIHVHAGPEISVASTKSFTGSIAALYLLSIYLGIGKGVLSDETIAELINEAINLPQKMERAIELEESLEALANLFYLKKGFLYLSRGINYPVAYEGAMKMKSLAYKHAEGFSGGEIKHGSLALIDSDTPVVAIIPADRHYKKILNDVEEIKTRGGTVIAFATEGDKEISKRFEHLFFLPQTSYWLNPIIFTIPIQLFAYFIALRRGGDIDKPRNLAKSVTVE